MSTPSDLFVSIVLRCPTRLILRIASIVPSLRWNKVFWTKYLNVDINKYIPLEQQERLHQLFLSCAENNHWEIFEYLWRTPLSASCGGQLIKERRSLHRSFKSAYLNGHKGMAWRLFRLDEGWMMWRYTAIDPEYEVYNISYDLWTIGYTERDHEQPVPIIEHEMEMCLAAKRGDCERLMTERNKFEFLLGYDPGITLSLIGKWLQLALLESNSFEFVKQIVYSYRSIGRHFLIMDLFERGKHELALRLCDEYEEGRNFLCKYLLVSNRSDSLELIRMYNPDFVLDNYYNSSLGNAEILLDYLQRFPNNHRVLISSYQTLPAEQFMRRYLEQTKVIGNNDISWFTLIVEHGYDHLAALVLKAFPEIKYKENTWEFL